MLAAKIKALNNEETKFNLFISYFNADIIFFGKELQRFEAALAADAAVFYCVSRPIPD